MSFTKSSLTPELFRMLINSQIVGTTIAAAEIPWNNNPRKIQIGELENFMANKKKFYCKF